MPCDEQVFPGVTPEIHDKLLAIAKDKGYDLPAMGGELKADGCTFSWAWDADKATLTVTCTKKPFFVSCDTVNAHIKALIDEAMGA